MNHKLDSAVQQQRAEEFARLHRSAPLVLPNAWDAGTARVIERAGATAIATTSGGCAWGLGRSDGGGLARDEVVRLIGSIVEAVDVPVTADIETGYGASLDELRATITAVLGAGAVGVNLEDSGGDPLYAPEEQAERIAAVRQAADAFGVPLFINARTDVYLFGIGDVSERLEHVINRARLYLDAGANGIFVPGLLDIPVLRSLVAAIPAPINAMVGPGAPSVAELVEAGVTRISAGTAIAQSAYAHVDRAAREMLEQGTYTAMQDALAYRDLNGMFSR